MKCEIEFLPVGEKGRPGDAIVIRYGDETNYELMIVDGGTADTGEKLVEHIHTHFGPLSVVSHVVLTHSDSDHACGLREVLAGLRVKNFWLHVPAYSAAGSRKYFADREKWSDESLKNKLLKEYDLITELVGLAQKQNAIVQQPFAGQKIGPFIVLSPTQDVYEMLMPQFSRTPEPDRFAIEQKGYWIGKQQRGFLRRMFETVREGVQTWIEDTWAQELLRDGGVTSASNESSVILYGTFESEKRVLLTGDAGIYGLTVAADIADIMGLPLANFKFVQIPHHGSRRNVGPTILNRLIGPIQQEGIPKRFTAYVSAPKDDHTHPRKMVLNAFMRRGGQVFATQGSKLLHQGGFPSRQGYSTVEPVPFSLKVENYD